MRSEDLPMVLQWRNHESVRSFMFNPHEITQQEHVNWFERTQKDPRRKLLITERDEKPFGFVQFGDVEKGGTASWGFYVDPTAEKGSGTMLGNAALAYAFDQLKLHKVCGQAIEENTASIAFHLKMGFRQEGLLLEHQKIGDIYHSIVCFGLLAKEWPLNRSEN